MGLEAETEITWFAETALAHGDDFASRDSKISAILTSPALSGPAKMAGVDAHLYPPID